MLTDDPSDATNGGASSSLLEELQDQQQQQQQQGPGSAQLGGKDFSYNWCVTELEGDEAALRLLEALESGSEAVIPGEQAQQGAQQLQLLGLAVPSATAASAALLGTGLGGRVDADVVSMLIGIYGGPLLFMEEYRNMLADRLLAKDDYDCEKEIRTLELLKIRYAMRRLQRPGCYVPPGY